MVIDLEKQMKTAAKSLEFEKAAGLRDQVIELRKALVCDTEALKELASVAGKDGMLPFSGKAPPTAAKHAAWSTSPAVAARDIAASDASTQFVDPSP